MPFIKFYFYQILLTLDQAANVIFFGGWADETISSHSYREYPKLAAVIDYVALKVFGDADHCHQAFLAERDQTQLPPEDRLKQ
jgi:hypothetical protein